jgi:elongation factor G
MPAYTTADIRNVALDGHGGAGKTTLTGALLHSAGALEVSGAVERGTTLMDYETEEKTHSHSMFSALASLEHEGLHVNLIDTPGDPDFLGSLSAVETAAVIIDAKSGVQTMTRRMMEAAKDSGLARMVIVNRIDLDDLSLDQLMAQIHEAFGSECLPINLPKADGAGVADCFFNPDESVDTAFSSVADAHTHIVDQVVEMDEQLMELYLEEGEQVLPEHLHDAFESALREGHLIPVCFSSATSGAGVAELLRVIERMMPNPAEGNQRQFHVTSDDGAGPVVVVPNKDAPLVAHVFKVSIDPFIGRMGLVRVHQGSLNKDTQLLVGDTRKAHRVGHVFRVHGKETAEMEVAIAGDICALNKLDELQFNTVLHDDAEYNGIAVNSVSIPAAMYGLAITAHARGDEGKLSDTLHKLSAEDPSFVVEHSTATNETVIRGLGDLHLRMMLERMEARYKVSVDTHAKDCLQREYYCVCGGASSSQETNRWGRTVW